MAEKVFPPALREDIAVERSDEEPFEEVQEPPPSYNDAVDAGASPRNSVMTGMGTLPIQAQAGVPSVRMSNDLLEPLTHIDFMDGPFSSQIQVANAWLRDNPQIRVLNCESIEVPRDNDGTSFGTGNTITDRSCFNLRVASNIQFVRGLRLWTVPREPTQPQKPQQLGYIDVIPKRKPAKSSVFGKEKFEFESLQDSVLRFNETIRAQPLPGRILNIQTCEVRFRERNQPGIEKFDENYFTWVREEKNSPAYYYLTYMKVFHEMSPFEDTQGCMQQCGFVDFAPKQIEGKSNKDFEQLQQPAFRIQNWINENQDKMVLGVQTVDQKFNKSPGSKFEVDTNHALLKETDTGDIRHLSVLRVVFLQFLDANVLHGMAPLTLSYKTFCPAKTARAKKSDPPFYETMGDSWKRALAWLKVTGTPILCTETVFIRAYPSKSTEYNDHEGTFVDTRSDWAEFWLAAVRVYFNGTYSEPPAHLLPIYPRLPPEEEDKCIVM